MILLIIAISILLSRETGALCAMKEVDIIPDDPKSAECMRQLEKVFFSKASNISVICSAINFFEITISCHREITFCGCFPMCSVYFMHVSLFLK